MQTIYEAAGGRDGLLRLASAWHTRVLEDEVVSHAFSHGYHPQHTERLAWRRLSLRVPALVCFDVELDIVRTAPSSGPRSCSLILGEHGHRKHNEQRHYEHVFHESPPASSLRNARENQSCCVCMNDVECGHRVSITGERVR